MNPHDDDNQEFTNAVATESASSESRLQSLENGIEKMMGIVETLAPLASLIPGGAVAVGVVEAAGKAADTVIDALQGEVPEGIDPAALAAGMVAHSTGDAALDARLMKIEAFIAALTPVLSYLGKEFGISIPESHVAAAPFINTEAA